MNITATNATLNALVNPNGASTDVYFQWGQTTNYSNSTPTTTLTEELCSPQAVALAAGGLAPGATNHFQVVAVNSAGTSFRRRRDRRHAAFAAAGDHEGRQSIPGGRADAVHHESGAGRHSASHLSLASSDPVGVSINPTNGVLSWAPTCVQGSSTNLITVWATDSGSPPLSNSMTFVVTNSDCVQVGLGSTVMQTGTTSSVPLTLISSVGLTNLSFAVVYPASRFTNWVVAVSNSAIGTTIVQSVSGAETLFDFEASPGESFQAPAVVGALYFTALSGPSGFVPLGVSNVTGTEQGGTLAGNISGQGGLVVLIGPQPLLDAWKSNSTRMITIYGNPGTNYQLSSSTTLAAPNWQPAFTVPMTNLFESVPVDQTAPRIFYRAQ